MFVNLMISTDTACYIGLALILFSYGFVRTLTGRLSFKKTEKALHEEGLLRSQRWVLTRIRFLLLRRITFCHLYLSTRRFILLHFLTHRVLLQAPLGPQGKAGKEEGRFEVEKTQSRPLLTLKTTLKGGGRLRFHVKDAKAWYQDILKG
jgi:hypothetical protein